jgi:cytochrome c oxidase subunit 3
LSEQGHRVSSYPDSPAHVEVSVAGEDHDVHPRLQHHFPNLHEQKHASTLGMWLFLVQEVMFFGGLFLAYAVYRNLYFDAFVAGSHHLDVKLGGINTAVLICSSLTMALGVYCSAIGKGKACAAWLLATVLLGSVFLGVKVFEYKDKWDNHLVPGARFSVEHLTHHGQPIAANSDLAQQAEIFYSLYFAMTGLHALHMIVGIPLLLILAWLAWRGYFSPVYHTPVEMFGLYWHFVDIVWIFLFPLLYLIGRHH